MTVNQSRRRVDVCDSAEPATMAPIFKYEPFGAPNQSFRLLTIEPAEGGSDGDPILCQLVNVDFGANKAYEALSYMWGGDEDQSMITLNGCSFSIRRNLLDAMRYLRRQQRKHPIWIDAVCINQNDIEERNRQLQIMHHIFDRATIVLVWLGERYSTYNIVEPAPEAADDLDIWGSAAAKKKKKMRKQSQWLDDSSMEPEAPTPPSPEILFSTAVNEDLYWHRLWIIQEVGQAKQILVCFGSTPPMQWSSFINLISRYEVDENGPLRLDKLRKNRDQGARNFKTLLIDHRQALCTEPRDKIYGLVGLADDAYRLPMDYQKPLLDVWYDVMHFVNKKQLVCESELISFGGLVRYLLMGIDFSSQLHQVLCRPHVGSVVLAEDDLVPPERVFKMQGFVIGQVNHVGISTYTVIARPDAIDDWDEKVFENFKESPKAANLENRTLRHAILTPPSTRTCYSYVGAIQWNNMTYIEEWNGRGDESKRPLLYRYVRDVSEFIYHHDPHQGLQAETTTEKDDSPRLIQVQSNSGKQPPCMMGIASSNVRLGDLIVWASSTSQALVVRCNEVKLSLDLPPQRLATLQIVGTAWTTGDLLATRMDVDERHAWLVGKYSIPVQMDASTLFVLVAQHDVR